MRSSTLDILNTFRHIMVIMEKLETLIVQKYGGTSVGSAERIKAVAGRIANSYKSSSKVVAVVSAMGDTTDNLINLANEISRKPRPREYDALISNGENISASLLAMAIHEHGIGAISLTGPQAGIRTENSYSKAKILNIDTARIQQELDKEQVVIITGFQGINEYLDVTTIGRGGSDTSAVALAAALGCKVCEIYTDVDGVYTTDPRIVKTASKIPEISYGEMLELASLGAKVLHPRAVECAKENGIEIHVRSSFNSNLGTIVKEASTMEVNRPVTGITLNKDAAKVSILKVPDQPGIAGKLFEKLSQNNINVDMIIQSAQKNHINNITFTVDQGDCENAVLLTKKIADDLGAEGVEWDDSVAKLSIVGVGMISKPGVAATMFKVLGDNNVNIQLISTSEIKISCVVKEDIVEDCLKLLHAAFELDAPIN